MQDLSSNLSLSCNEFIKQSDAGARMLDSFCHMILK